MPTINRTSVIAWGVAGMSVLLGIYAIAHRFPEKHDEQASKLEQERSGRRRGSGWVALSATLIKNAGIETAAAESTTWIERVAVYGRVVPNPKSTFDVRTPFAGVVHEAEDVGWPQLGRSIRAGDVLGILEIRVGPQERLDLESKLKEARLRNQGASEVEKVQRERIDRLRKLTNADIVSQREMVDALVALAEAQTQLASTKSALDLWTAATAQINEPSQAASRWRIPLTSPAEGEVAQVLIRPGTAVEAGSPVIRVVNFHQLLIRLDIPPDLLAAPPLTVRLTADGGDEEGIEAQWAGTTPQVDVTSQMSGYWYEAKAKPSERRTWRPGLFVQALITPPDAKPSPAVAVSGDAVLFHEGQRWVYVQSEPGKYHRRSVQPLGRQAGRWVVGAGVVAGEMIVAKHAQTVLSEELRTEVEED